MFDFVCLFRTCLNSFDTFRVTSVRLIHLPRRYGRHLVAAGLVGHRGRHLLPHRGQAGAGRRRSATAVRICGGKFVSAQLKFLDWVSCESNIVRDCKTSEANDLPGGDCEVLQRKLGVIRASSANCLICINLYGSQLTNRSPKMYFEMPCQYFGQVQQLRLITPISAAAANGSTRRYPGYGTTTPSRPQ